MPWDVSAIDFCGRVSWDCQPMVLDSINQYIMQNEGGGWLLSLFSSISFHLSSRCLTQPGLHRIE